MPRGHGLLSQLLAQVGVIYLRAGVAGIRAEEPQLRVTLARLGVGGLCKLNDCVSDVNRRLDPGRYPKQIKGLSV